jgi:hypothetical protein
MARFDRADDPEEPAAGDYREEALRRASTGGSVNVEAYFAASLGPPRWAERLTDLEGEELDLIARLREAWIELAEEVSDGAAFARAWTARVHATSLERINTLVDQHNEFYPVERRLPWDFRLADYRAPWGVEWRRPRRDAAWLLDALPADRAAAVRERRTGGFVTRPGQDV